MSIALLGSQTILAAEENENWAVANESVQVSVSELKLIAKALLKTEQIPADKLSATYVEKAAKDFMLYKALATKAQSLGLDKSPEIQKLLEMNEQRILGATYLADYLDKLELPDFEKVALETYTLNKKQYMQQETVRAQHILINFQDDENKSQKYADEVREIALNGGKSFSDLAKEYSQDPSVSQNSGDLGFFDRSQMVPAFSEAAFALKVDEISQPVKTQYGWHIVKVIDKKPARLLDFSEVKDNLISKARQDFRDQARNDKLRETVYTAKLKVNQDLIKKVTDELLKN